MFQGSRLCFSDSLQQNSIGTGCVESAVGASPVDRQPGGAAPAGHAMLRNGVDVSGCGVWGLPSCLCAWSRGAAGGACKQWVGRWLETNPWHHGHAQESWCWAWALGLKLLSETAPRRAGCRTRLSRRAPAVQPPSLAPRLPLLRLTGLLLVCCWRVVLFFSHSLVTSSWCEFGFFCFPPPHTSKSKRPRGVIAGAVAVLLQGHEDGAGWGRCASPGSGCAGPPTCSGRRVTRHSGRQGCIAGWEARRRGKQMARLGKEEVLGRNFSRQKRSLGKSPKHGDRHLGFGIEKGWQPCHKMQQCPTYWPHLFSCCLICHGPATPLAIFP